MITSIPALAQQIPSGKYVDLVGSEDYFVIVKSGKIAASECGRVCPPLSAFKIVGVNKAMSSLRVTVPGGKTVSLCLDSTAPKWANMSQIAYCDFNRGWTRTRPN